MKQWQYGFLILLSIIPFFFYFWNPLLNGADTYFYLNQICLNEQGREFEPLLNFVFQSLPCSIPLIKLFLLLQWCVVVLISAKIGEIYDKDKGWWMGIIAASFTFLITEYYILEADTLGITFFFISFYFAMVWDKKKEWKAAILSIFFILIGGLFWRGEIYYLIPIAIFIPIALIFFIPLYFYYLKEFFWFLFPNHDVGEQSSLLSIIYLGFTAYLMFGFLKTSKKIALSFILMLILSLFVLKLYVLPIPFAIFGAFYGLKSLRFPSHTIEITLIVVSLILCGFWGMFSLKQFPTNGDYELVKYTKYLTSSVENTFGAGYFLQWNGLEVSSRGGEGNNDYNFNTGGYKVLMAFNSFPDHCSQLKNSENLLLLYCN